MTMAAPSPNASQAAAAGGFGIFNGAALAAYFVRSPTGKVIGPLPQELLCQLVMNGKFSGTEGVRVKDSEEWVPLKEVPAFGAAIRIRQSSSATDQGVASPEVEAQLDALGVTPLFLWVARRQLTGWLRVERDKSSKVVSFLCGRPINVRSNDPKELFCEFLITQGKVTQEQASDALELSRTLSIPVGNALVTVGALKAGDVPTCLREQALFRIRQLFSWTEGHARFDADPLAGRDDDMIGQSALKICAEMAAQISDEQLAKLLGGSKARYDLAEPLMDGASPLLEEVMASVLEADQHDDHSREIKAMVAKVREHGYSPSDILRAFFLLVAMGSLRRVTGVAAERLRQRLFQINLYAILGIEDEVEPDKLLEAIARLREEVGKTLEAEEIVGPERDAIEQRLTQLEQIADDPLERHIMARAHYMRVDASDASVRDALETEYLERIVLNGVKEGNYQDVLPLAELILTKAPLNMMAVAYRGLAKGMLCTEEAEALEVLQELQAKAVEYPLALELHLVIAEIGLRFQRRHEVRRAVTAAEGIAPVDPRVQDLQRRLKELGFLKTTAVVAVKEVEAGASEPLRVLNAASVVIGFFFLLWLVYCVLGQGDQEYFYSGGSGMWYLRRLLLVLAAVGGGAWFFKLKPKELFKGVGFKAPVTPLMVAVLVGAASGFMSAPQRVTGGLFVVMFLTLLHVAAEQVFFTAFLTRGIMKFASPQAAVLVSAVLFGIYHVTYYSFFIETYAMWIPYWIGLIILGAGLPYALLYAWSRSIVPPLVCHLLVNGVMMFNSVARMAGGDS